MDTTSGIVLIPHGDEVMRRFYRSLLKDVVQFALDRFRSNLKKSNRVRNLLREMQVSESVLERFDVGYATREWASLTERIGEKASYYRDCARTLGVLREGKRGLYDYFRDRIILPVRDSNGDAVGFTSRSLQSLREAYRPKKFDKVLLNSPHSPIFDKWDCLVGYHVARGSILDGERVLVTLDPVELLKLHSTGRSHAVMELIPGGFDRPAPTSQHRELLEGASLDVMRSGG